MFCKTKYITLNKDRFDSFLFGSSRVGHIPNDEVTSSKIYNFSYMRGIPYDHFLILNHLIKSGVKIKNVIIGLDDFTYKLDAPENYNSVNKSPPPEVSGKNPVEFLLAYVRFELPAKKQKENMNPYFMTSGRLYVPADVEELIEKNPDGHRNNKNFNTPNLYPNKYYDNAIQSMQKIKKLCDENHINLTVFINPIHRVTLKSSDIQQFNKFRRELVKITPYTDFAYFNSISKDNYNWFETSHYRPFIGRLILVKTGYLENIKVPDDFGKYVTSENIDEHLRFTEENYKQEITNRLKEK